MKHHKFYSAMCCMALAGCGGSGSDSNAGNQETLPSVRTIETIEDFNATIVGNTLVLKSDDGSRNPEGQLVVESNMKVTGFLSSGEVDLDWYWENTTFCRSGVSSLPDNPQTVEFECQGVDLNENVVSFVGDSGAGDVRSIWFIE